MIEIGSEWFNRESLAAVSVEFIETVRYGDDEPNIPHKIWLQPTGERETFWRDPENFLRDYARNEPVTLELLELLERMGWVTAMFDEGPVRHRFLRLSEHPIDLRWSDDGSFHVIFESYVEQPLAPVTTLRDLLNVLRVFGVEQPVTVS